MAVHQCKLHQRRSHSLLKSCCRPCSCSSSSKGHLLKRDEGQQARQLICRLCGCATRRQRLLHPAQRHEGGGQQGWWAVQVAELGKG